MYLYGLAQIILFNLLILNPSQSVGSDVPQSEIEFYRNQNEELRKELAKATQSLEVYERIGKVGLEIIVNRHHSHDWAHVQDKARELTGMWKSPSLDILVKEVKRRSEILSKDLTSLLLEDMDTVNVIMKVYFDFQCASCIDDFFENQPKDAGYLAWLTGGDAGYLSWLDISSKKDATPAQWYTVMAFEQVANELRVPLSTDYHRTINVTLAENNLKLIGDVEAKAKKIREEYKDFIRNDNTEEPSSEVTLANGDKVTLEPQVNSPAVLRTHYIPTAPAAPPPPLSFPQKNRPLPTGRMLPTRHKDLLPVIKQGPFPDVEAQSEMKTMKSPKNKGLDDVVGELQKNINSIKLRKVDPQDRANKLKFTPPSDLGGLVQNALFRRFQNVELKDIKENTTPVDDAWMDK